MTDEYKAFLDSRNEETEKTLKWKPPERAPINDGQPMPFSDYLAHYGIKGMKWGIINEEKDEKNNKQRGMVEQTIHNAKVALGDKNAKNEDNLKTASESGIKQAEVSHEYFVSLTEKKTSANKARYVEDYLWDIRGSLSIDNIGGYKMDDPDATKQVYKGAKQFDLLMQQFVDENGGGEIDDNEIVKKMRQDCDDLNDLYYEIREKGVKYPDSDPEYANKYNEVHKNLDKYTEDIAKSLNILPEDEKSAGRIKNDLKVLLFKTGYTDLNGYDNSDWTQAGEAIDRREQYKRDRDKGVQHAGIETADLPYFERRSIRSEVKPGKNYLSHHGIPHMRWGYRRFQYKDGTLTPEGKIRYGKGGGDKQSGDGDDSERKSKGSGERSYNSKTSTYKKSDADKLTDEELNRRIQRLQREKQYQDLLPKTKSEKRREAIRAVFIKAASDATSSVIKDVTTRSIKRIFNLANNDNNNNNNKKNKNNNRGNNNNS